MAGGMIRFEDFEVIRFFNAVSHLLRIWFVEIRGEIWKPFVFAYVILFLISLAIIRMMYDVRNWGLDFSLSRDTSYLAWWITRVIKYRLSWKNEI